MLRRWLLALPLLVAAAGAALADDARVAQARRTLGELNLEEAALAERVGANRAELARVLGGLQLFSRDPPPALMADPAEVKDAVRAAILIRAIAPALEARARALSSQAQDQAVLRRRAAAASGELFSAESELADRRSRLDGVMTDADTLSPPSVRGATGAGEAPPTHLTAPTAGDESAAYGGRLADGTKSYGLAWRPAPGAPVVAPASAVVDYAGPLNGWGIVLILRAGGGCHMVLSGLGKVTVTSGQSVAAGQAIGAMASDGQKSRELYFEVRMGGTPVDPARLIAGTPRQTASGART